MHPTRRPNLRIAWSLCSSLLLLAPLFAPAAFAADPAQGNAALQQGRADEAANILRSVISTQPDNDLAHQLLCRVFYAQDMADPAIHECELAVSNGPNSSDHHLWLGRAYGLKASQVSAFTAFGFAKKVRDQFERSAQLDPRAPRAASDLGQFYISAPGIVGGGTEKALDLIRRIEPEFPVYSHRLRALLAEKKKDLPTAETEFKNAIDAGKSLGAQDAPAWIDLADFYRRHGKPDQVVAAIQSALALNPKGPPLVDAASLLIEVHRSPELAERLLRDYLASSAKTDESPAFKVHLQLGDLLKQRGDSAAAHAHYIAAAALAANWAPARKALQSS